MKKLLKVSRSNAAIPGKHIIPRAKHHVSKTDVSVNALKVLNRLHSAGFQAYLVGGSVRDLLLHKSPKDFDIATNATPNEIKRLFRNARIIGRRFKLAHVIYYRDIIEVATFRGSKFFDYNHQKNEQGILVRDNVYGTLEEDAWRRDFTINSLYYNIEDFSLVDFTGGFADINNKLIRIIGDANNRYQEDPVRMLRAIRFSAKLHFDIESETAKAIEKLNELILHVSSSRLFDEIIKLYHCGEANRANKLLIQYKLFGPLFPQTAKLLEIKKYNLCQLLDAATSNTDARIKENKPVTAAFIFAVLLWFPLKSQTEILIINEQIGPLQALEQAMAAVIYEQNKIITMPKRITQTMREIWLLQSRFGKRIGNRPFNLIKHPRFRAAYDFLLLRAIVADEKPDLAVWWTKFQEVTEEEQQKMINALTKKKGIRKKKTTD